MRPLDRLELLWAARRSGLSLISLAVLRSERVAVVSSGRSRLRGYVRERVGGANRQG
jgi:hypothetical protein